jgi:predicted  nucleic acid-binding Zn-ribbon protein
LTYLTEHLLGEQLQYTRLPTKLPDNIKSAVIQQWLQGKARDLIAVDTGSSAGAVTNIINKWRKGLGYPLADELRELATTLKKIGITATQCAVGFRLATIMIKLGIDEEKFESFISDIYEKCKKLDLQPDNIAYYIDELLRFSKDISVSQIPDYIKQKTDYKNKLEKKIEGIEDRIKQLEQEKSDAEELLTAALENEKMTTSELKWNSHLKIELKKYGIPIEDVRSFAKAIHGLRQYGYDVDKIIAEFSDLENLKNQFQLARDSIPALEKKFENLNGECILLDQTIASHRQTLAVYYELEQMSFGLKELKLLRHTVVEIAKANNLSSKEALQKFIKDVEEQYDDKLGFESKLDKLRSDIVNINDELAISRSKLLVQPLVGHALQRLFENGIKEQDIIELASIFETYGGSSSSSSSSRAINPIDKQSLITELAKYGSIKAMIQPLEQKYNELKNEVASLEAKKNELKNRNDRMLSTLEYSKQIMYYFKGLVDSLRDKIQVQYLNLVYVNYILNLQFKQILKLDGNSILGEFAPILMAAKLERDSKYQSDDNNDRDVTVSSSINQLKEAVAKAIILMINNLKYRNNLEDNNLIEILGTARLALEEKEHSH